MADQNPISKFDRQALMKLGSLTASRNIQGVYQLSLRLSIADRHEREVNFDKSATFPSRMQAPGRLQDLLPGPDGKSKRGLSVVEISMGGSNVPKPPLHRSNPYCISCSLLTEHILVI